jgi:glutaredoxin
MIRKLTTDECTTAIEKGDFDLPEETGALILTQSWCPQWTAMKNCLEQADKTGNITILYVEYDKEQFFQEFMKFKEETYGNREIPYVRYFKNGVFLGDSNYVSLEGFLHRLT